MSLARWRALAGVLLTPVLWLAIGALLTPLPAALGREGNSGSSIRFVDREGELLREVRADGDAARATWGALDEVGETVASAMLAAEDRRFGERVGVDPVAAVRAAVTSLVARRIVSGASTTITMQLARLVAPHPRMLRGKLGEMAMAVRIEASLSKRQIPEQYLNRAPFGSGVRGIGAASDISSTSPYYSLVRRPDRVLIVWRSHIRL